jgi:demethylmenaquinone methyltransferase/2-methoxy-6-polyprenyl-1,4-benzoquinol methylase
MNKGIQKIFGEVPRTYELVNHLLTFGADIICRRRAAEMAVREGGTMWLDVCSGTGEMAANLARLGRNGTNVYGADFSLPMIRMAAQKSEAKKVGFVISDVGKLPFGDGSFDLVTISFATRNINTSLEGLTATLKEFHRVLRPGGRFVNLETSQPRSGLIRKMMHLYVRLAVRRVGSAISGSEAGYAYLSQTIPRFYPPKQFADIIQKAGFSTVTFRPMFFGIIAVHYGVKGEQ